MEWEILRWAESSLVKIMQPNKCFRISAILQEYIKGGNLQYQVCIVIPVDCQWTTAFFQIGTTVGEKLQNDKTIAIYLY